MSDLVQLAAKEGVATVTLNRPEARNALSTELIQSLLGVVEKVRLDDDIRVMILAGHGKCFCAGMDLKGVLHDPEAMGDMLHGLSQVMRNIRRLSIPTISRVQGAAVGGGCGLMVMTDFAFTHAEAKVGYPEVDLGVCPAVVAPWLIRKIGAGPARSMLLAGGTMSGQDGYERGLASHLVKSSDLESSVLEFAQKLASGGKTALAATKNMLNELDGSMEDELFIKAATLSAKIVAGEEAQARLKTIFG